MLRLFVAVDLPTDLRDEVGRMMGQVHNARWVNAQQLHITLRFLGETPDAALPDIQARLRATQVDAFRLRLRSVDTFPDAQASKGRKPPKVLWLGIEPTANLAQLKQAIDGALSVALTRENQLFSPHLTLARFPSPPDNTLSDFLTKNRNHTSSPWLVTNFHLYQSTLRREGAIHTLIESYPLARANVAE